MCPGCQGGRPSHFGPAQQASHPRSRLGFATRGPAWVRPYGTLSLPLSHTHPKAQYLRGHSSPRSAPHAKCLRRGAAPRMAAARAAVLASDDHPLKARAADLARHGHPCDANPPVSHRHPPSPTDISHALPLKSPGCCANPAHPEWVRQRGGLMSLVSAAPDASESLALPKPSALRASPVADPSVKRGCRANTNTKTGDKALDMGETSIWWLRLGCRTHTHTHTKCN